jgi:hypothetical protein
MNEERQQLSAPATEQCSVATVCTAPTNKREQKCRGCGTRTSKHAARIHSMTHAVAAAASAIFL